MLEPLGWNCFNANTLNLGCNEPFSLAFVLFFLFFKWVQANEPSRTVSVASEQCKHLMIVLLCPFAGQDPQCPLTLPFSYFRPIFILARKTTLLLIGHVYKESESLQMNKQLTSSTGAQSLQRPSLPKWQNGALIILCRISKPHFSLSAKAAAERLSLPNINLLHCLSGVWHFRGCRFALISQLQV